MQQQLVISPKSPLKKSKSTNYMQPGLRTLAELNQVCMKSAEQHLIQKQPLRILLPAFFNIPQFHDKQLNLQAGKYQQTLSKSRQRLNAQARKKIKDLSILAQGMKRAKNIKEESRTYFTQGVLLHNEGEYAKSIDFFEKFLKIVLFLKDQKSVQLALNSIGINYMYCSQPKRALQYHIKQHNLTQRSDTFIGAVNAAMCYEMMHKDQAAYNWYYSELKKHNQSIFKSDSTKRIKYLQKALMRVEDKLRDVGNLAFMTQQLKQRENPRQMRQQQLQSSHKAYYKRLINNSPSKRVQEYARINYAIMSAEKNLSSFIQDMRSQYVEDRQ